MRIYIATGFERRAFAQRFFAQARELVPELEWTYDWTVGTHDDDATDVACGEFQGVANADAVVVLLPGGPGTHAELGLALGRSVPTLVVGDIRGRCSPNNWPDIPLYLMADNVLNWRDAVAWLKKVKCRDL